MKNTLKILALATLAFLVCSSAEAGTSFVLHISGGSVTPARTVYYYPSYGVGVTRYVPTSYARSWGTTYYQYPYQYTYSWCPPARAGYVYSRSVLRRPKYFRVPSRKLTRTRYRYRNGYYYVVR